MAIYPPSDVDLIEANKRLQGEVRQLHQTLRDQFAMAALTGLMANYGNDIGSDEDRARWSYEQADAMMKARES